MTTTTAPRAGAPARAGGEARQDIEAARALAPACAAAGVALGLALQWTNGFLQPAGLGLVSMALALLAVATVVPRPAAWHRHDRRAVQALALGGLLAHQYYLVTAAPGFYVRAGAADLSQFHAGALVLTAVAAAAIAVPSRRAALPLALALVVAHAGLGTWIIERSPNPAIDVHMFQREAVDALLRGENPYALTFPDIYGESGFYGPGLSVDGRLQFGFPYFPLSLLAAMPGQLLAGDPRYSQLLASEATALLLALARPGGLGLPAAALYLTTPRGFFVLEQSWTEPFVVLGSAVVVAAASRRSALVPWLFGAFLAIKQYLVFAVPAGLLLTAPRTSARRLVALLARAAAVGAAVTLPFVLWDPQAFVHSVVTLQVHQPFRTDALSYLAWWVSLGHPPPSTAIPFVLASAAAALAAWRLPRTAAGFAAALSLTFLVFFAFNKQAFANYYFFVVGTLFATVAAWAPPAGEA